MTAELRPRKVFDFTGAAERQPNVFPGDRIDQQYEVHADAIAALRKSLYALQRSDGEIANQSVHWDALTDDVKNRLLDPSRDIADMAIAEATRQAQLADIAATDADQAAAEARTLSEGMAALKSFIEGAAQDIETRIAGMLDTVVTTAQLAADTRAAVDNSQNDAALAAATAQDWAIASQDWAEHMPDTIPPNTLAVMGITGDHWSSRWWANYVDQKLSAWQPEYDSAIDGLDEFNDLYLGAHAGAPTTDNDGDPLQVGAMYWDTTQFEMFVWTGTSWASISGGGSGTISTAENLGGGHGVFAQAVGPSLQFKSLRWDASFAITDTATEIQIALSSVAWGIISGKPNTLAGYGITDAYTKAQVDASQAGQDAQINTKAATSYVDGQDAALQSQITSLSSGKADKSYVDSQDAGLQSQITSLSSSNAGKADKTYVDSQNAAQDAVTALKVDKTGNTGAAKLPSGTTAQQPASPQAGYIRFNTTTGKFEGHNGTAWGTIGGGAAISDTPPSNPAPGDLWWSSALGLLFVYYDDGTSAQWVTTTPAVDQSQFVKKSGDTMTGTLTAPNLNIDANAGLGLVSGNPTWALDSGDSINYDRTNNIWNFYVGGAVKATLNGGGAFNGSMFYLDAQAYWTITGGNPLLSFDSGDNFSFNRAANQFAWTIGGSAQLVLSTSGAQFTGSISPSNDTTMVYYSTGTVGLVAMDAGGYLQINKSTKDIGMQGSGGVRWTCTNANGYFYVPVTGLKPGGGAWADSSDARIKNVHGDYTSGLAEILALQPKRFSYKGNEHRFSPSLRLKAKARETDPDEYEEAEPESPHAQVVGREFVGLIAQEVEAIMPELISLETATIDGKPVDDLRQLDCTPVIYALVNAVKELSAQVDALKAQIAGAP